MHQLDETTKALVTIDTSHHEVHEGDMFVYCEVNDITNGAVRDILFVTPATKSCHLVINVVSEAEADFKFYESTTASNNGTGVTAYNRKRTSTNTATALVYHTPTVAGGSEGTLLCMKHWGSGKSNGGEDRSANEWILKASTKHLIRVTNATASNNQIAIELEWYEE